MLYNIFLEDPSLEPKADTTKGSKGSILKKRYGALKLPLPTYSTNAVCDNIIAIKCGISSQSQT